MADYDSEKLIAALKEATGISDESNIRTKLNEHREDELISAIESNDFDLTGYENFLKKYRRELIKHEENASHIKQIQKNYSEIEKIYNSLQSEINTALDESVELEKISKALGDKKLLKKAKRDEATVKNLKGKLEHLISIKAEMEELESRLESATEHFDDIEHAVERRKVLVSKMIEESKMDGSRNTGHMIVSLSDVHGHKNRMDEALNLLSRSGDYPAFSDGDYTLVLNGDAFDDRSGTEGRSEEVFYFLKSMAGSGNLVYTFGNHDQFILFREFWCAIGQHHSSGGYADPFFLEISDEDRKWFVEQIISGCITGQWDGDYDYSYVHAEPHGNLNSELEAAAEEIKELLNGKDPYSVLSESEVKNILSTIDSTFGLYKDSSANGIGDIDTDNPGDLEAIIAIEYMLQFDRHEEIFRATDGYPLWTRWDDLVSANPSGKYIVGHTMSHHCSSGTSFFSDGTNPRFADGGDLINENTIRNDETSILVEKPDGNVCALREEGGSVNEVCLSDHAP